MKEIMLEKTQRCYFEMYGWGSNEVLCKTLELVNTAIHNIFRENTSIQIRVDF